MTFSMMLGRLAVLAGAALLPAQALAADATFMIGEKSFSLPIPAGFCEPSGKDRTAAQIIAAADTENVTLLTLLRCDHVQGTDIPDYFLVKTPVRALNLDMGREELLTALQQQFDAMGSNVFSPASKQKAESGITNATGKAVSLGGEYKAVGRTGGCIDMAGTMTFQSGTINRTVDAASCLTGVGGKFIAVHHYRTHGVLSIAQLLQTVRSVGGAMTVAP